MSSCASGYRPTWDCRKHWKVVLWCVDWSGWGQRQVAGFCECGNEHSYSIKLGTFLTRWVPVSFSRTPLHHSVSQLVISTIAVPALNTLFPHCNGTFRQRLHFCCFNYCHIHVLNTQAHSLPYLQAPLLW